MLNVLSYNELNMDGSLLLRLSPELRNLIYLHTFSSSFKVMFRDGEIQHALTKTCRQIRHESLSMYYTLTRFNAHLRAGPVTPLIRWMSLIGKDACLLVGEITLWDMHDNVLTLLSPASATQYIADGAHEGINRMIQSDCSLPESNALPEMQRLQLWDAINRLGLGLKQVYEQFGDSSIIHRTSAYALTEK